jgi:hypothetical protein
LRAAQLPRFGTLALDLLIRQNRNPLIHRCTRRLSLLNLAKYRETLPTPDVARGSWLFALSAPQKQVPKGRQPSDHRAVAQASQRREASRRSSPRSEILATIGIDRNFSFCPALWLAHSANRPVGWHDTTTIAVCLSWPRARSEKTPEQSPQAPAIS